MDFPALNQPTCLFPIPEHSLSTTDRVNTSCTDRMKACARRCIVALESLFASLVNREKVSQVSLSKSLTLPSVNNTPLNPQAPVEAVAETIPLSVEKMVIPSSTSMTAAAQIPLNIELFSALPNDVYRLQNLFANRLRKEATLLHNALQPYFSRRWVVEEAFKNAPLDQKQVWYAAVTALLQQANGDSPLSPLRHLIAIDWYPLARRILESHTCFGVDDSELMWIRNKYQPGVLLALGL